MTQPDEIVPGMRVIARDGALGVVVERADVATSSSSTERFAIQGSDGRLWRLIPAMVRKVTADTIYLDFDHTVVPEIPVAESRPANTEKTTTARVSDSDDDRLVIPMLEEELEVGTREVDLGRLIVRKHVDERVVEERLAVSYDDVDIQRIPVDRVVPEPIAPYMDGDVLVVPLVEEEIVEVVVTRQLRLKEELRITRRSQERLEVVRTPLRSERVEIDEQRYDDAAVNDTAGSEDVIPGPNEPFYSDSTRDATP